MDCSASLLRSYNFHGKMCSMFDVLAIAGNRALTREEDIEKALKLNEYTKNETLALYLLRKYCHLKRSYPATHEHMSPLGG
ncbi:hypothetical protein FIBSPDRAFT_858032 [Athelia psychrophila]|uniref:Uncharacterized protein n=1 Tax=Athelia psychrophila TaxID=1759441 RepID=A0A166MCW3_9AGAM|nr:hypothetical protein FIBSPDRAFT_858032 [Fibularhizoctonia sp. CBS 109695]